MAKNQFEEKQRMNQWWLHLILFSVDALLLYGVFKQTILKEDFGRNPTQNGILIGTFLFTVLIHFLITNFIKLETKVDKYGIYYRFIPFVNSLRFIDRNELKSYAVVKYNPIADYGGWGYRTSLGKGKAYNTNGNMGLRLEFHSGKPLLIGTQKPEELGRVLKELWIDGVEE